MLCVRALLLLLLLLVLLVLELLLQGLTHLKGTEDHGTDSELVFSCVALRRHHHEPAEPLLPVLLLL
jgi:hypothetical protein